MANLTCPVCKKVFYANYAGRVCCSRACSDRYGGAYVERFWRNKRVSSDGCWEWQGRLEKNGYGRLRRHRLQRHVSVHRLSWELTFGAIPDGLCVLHRCDNRRCYNPEHLFLGTHKDNVQDMLQKGRSNNARGERHGRAKLSDAQVEQMRDQYASGGYTQLDLARAYSVHTQTVFRIIHGLRRKKSG